MSLAANQQVLEPLVPISVSEIEALLPNDADEALGKAVRLAAPLRRDLHAHPELSLQEHRTAGRIAAELRRIGCDEVLEGIGMGCSTGVAARIRGRKPSRHPDRRTIGLRADTDALALQETSGAAYASTRSGVAHACGHDGHAATLLAAAVMLVEARDSLAGDVVLIFQPGEEGKAGAKRMLDDPAFKRFVPDEIYALHGAPELPVGTFGVTRGWMQAAADKFRIEVRTPGGHGARPHLTVDAIVTAGRVVEALQTIVSRDVDPLHPAVLSVGSIAGGSPEGVSVLPANVVMTGTVRTTHPADSGLIERRMTEVCTGVGMTMGAEVTLSYERIYPVLVNDDVAVAHAKAAAEAVAGSSNAAEIPPGMGAEDFAFFLERIPGAYVRLGLKDDAHHAGLHRPDFDFNDRAIAYGARFFATLVKTRLR